MYIHAEENSRNIKKVEFRPNELGDKAWKVYCEPIFSPSDFYIGTEAGNDVYYLWDRADHCEKIGSLGDVIAELESYYDCYPDIYGSERDGDN